MTSGRYSVQHNTLDPNEMESYSNAPLGSNPTMDSFLPEELLASVKDTIQCRELQIQQLACLLASNFPSPSTLVLHGREATGKSLTINALLRAIETPSAIVRSKECITTRHLLERTLSEVQNALGEPSRPIDGRCESISAFFVQLQRLLEGQKKFILIFDNIDRQREPAPTLLPALARLGEMIPNLTTVFILTFPHPRQFHHAGIPHIHFPSYTRAELISLVSSSPVPLEQPPGTSPPPTNRPSFTPSDLEYLWPRFVTAVHDALAQPAQNSLPSLRTLCARLWPPFIAPILSNQYTPREFSKLMVRNRHLFQSEDFLKESIITASKPQPSSAANTDLSMRKRPGPTFTLPKTPAQILITAYLASHIQPKHDTLLFSKYSSSRRKRRGGGAIAPRTPNKKKAAHRKISRQMFGAQAFGLERMLAIYAAFFGADGGYGGARDGKRKVVDGGGAEILMQFSTLVGMNLIVRGGATAGGGEGGGWDPLEAGGGKWRCNVGLDYVRQLARVLRFDLDNYLLE
ncbi:MAG: hypothetical protein Q9181_002712 [Wetmoreana brouardii]